MYLTIIILLLLGSIASGFFGRKSGVSGAQIITCTAVVVPTTILAVLTFFEVGLNNITVSIEVFRWIGSESLNVSWGFHLESLTVPLSVLWEKKKNMETKMRELKQDRTYFFEEGKKARGTLRLSNMVDESQNNSLKELKEEYKDFFDEHSGNDTKTGLGQVIEYLTEEHSKLQFSVMKLKRDIAKLDMKIENNQQLNSQIGESSNINSMFVILAGPFNLFVYLRPFIATVLPYFSLLVTIFSLLFISIDLPLFIHNIVYYIKDCIKYEIAIYLPLLLWYFYTYIKKIKKIWTIGIITIRFIKTSYYTDFWVLLVMFILIIFF